MPHNLGMVTYEVVLGLGFKGGVPKVEIAVRAPEIEIAKVTVGLSEKVVEILGHCSKLVVYNKNINN
jgi:hypothetical protein